MFMPLPGSGNTASTVHGQPPRIPSPPSRWPPRSLSEVVTDVGSPGPSRGRRPPLQYTINFQVSDFFALENLIAIPTCSPSGQSFDATFTPTISFTQHGVPISGAFPAGTFSVARHTVTTGQTTVAFNVAEALADLGLATGTDILGGLVAPTPRVRPPRTNRPYRGTTGTITFRAQIDNTVPSCSSRPPTPPVVQGDQFGDSATVSAGVLNNADLSPTGNTASDGTSASVAIPHGVFTKTVYAVNGVVGASPNTVTVGDLVTYDLTFTLPEGNVKDYQLNDYLPLPIFPITSMTFVPGGPSIPVVNTATFGPADTFFAASGIVPATTVNTAGNSINFDFGDFQFVEPRQPRPRTSLASCVQVRRHTVRRRTAPEQPGSGERGFQHRRQFLVQRHRPDQVERTVAGYHQGRGLDDRRYRELQHRPQPPPGVTFADPGTTTSPPFTGLINSTRPRTSSPIDASLTNAQSGDLVRFAIVVENVGAGQLGAFNVTVEDAFPTSPVPNYTLIAGSLQITDGAPAIPCRSLRTCPPPALSSPTPA